jgi:cyclic pyranopterin phosphate synthase
VRAAVAVGFHKFRLTGGEPTLRPEIVEITKRIASVAGVEDLAMTTNGILLPRLAKPLRDAGLKRLNIHVDTLHPERLKKLMRFASIEEMEAGIAAAEQAGLVPIKLNSTVTATTTTWTWWSSRACAKDRDWHVRFIELMPLGGGETAHVALSQFVPTAETRRRIEAELGPLQELPPTSAADESRNFRFEGGRGRRRLHLARERAYCGSCNRMRLDRGREVPPVPAERRRARRQAGAAHGRRARPRSGDPAEGRSA